MTLWLLVAQLMASTAMAAIAWFVDLVHYPLFRRVDPGESGAEFHRENVRRTKPVVLVPMAVEAATAAAVALVPPPAIGAMAAWGGVALVVAAVVSTGFVQVPLHGRLTAGEGTPATVDALVRSTRVRSAIWTARALLAAWMVIAFARAG